MRPLHQCLSLLVPASIVVCFLGCGKNTDPAKNADAATLLESRVSTLQKQIDGRTFSWFNPSNEPAKSWVRSRLRLSDIKYDARKTDSLVSPVVGVVTFVMSHESAGTYPTKAQAEAASSFGDSSKSDWIVHLTFRDNKFVYQSAEKLSRALGKTFTVKSDGTGETPDDLVVRALQTE